MTTYCNHCKAGNKTKKHKRHLERATRNRRDRSLRLQAKGICPKCVDVPGSAKHEKVCLKPQRERGKRTEAKGHCRAHPSRKAILKGVCEECTYRRRSINLIGNGSLHTALKQKLKDQAFKCIYSGQKLNIKTNATVDHRTPLARGGTSDIENLQWVDAEINTVYKGALSHQNFLDLCQVTWLRKVQGHKLDEFDSVLSGVWEYQCVGLPRVE